MKMKKTILIIISVLVVVLTLGLSYAYFSAIVQRNEDAETMVVTADTLILKYIDGPEIEISDAYPGKYVEKEVRVENIGTGRATYAIGFIDFLNQFINDELVISYTCTSYENYGKANQAVSGTCPALSTRPVGNDLLLEEVIRQFLDHIEVNEGTEDIFNIDVILNIGRYETVFYNSKKHTFCSNNTFYHCTSLVNAPTIPNSVTNMNQAFYGCAKLMGDVIIEAKNVTYATSLFYDTVLNISLKAEQGTTTWTTLSGITLPANVTLQPYQ